MFSLINSIQCDNCEQWIHQESSHLTNEKFESMSLEENSWYCRNCTSVSLPYSNIEDDDLFTENLDLPNLSNNVKIIPSTRLKNIINECNKLTEKL